MDTERNPLEGLTPEQGNILFSFSELTQIDDTNLCRSILSQNDWNLDVAVENFINNQSQPSFGGNETNNERMTQRDNRSDERGGFFEIITSPLRWLFQTTPISLVPEQDTAQFVDKFRLEYGSGREDLNWERTSYAQAVRKAYRQSKFLLVYLHSPLHEDTHRFCSQVLYSGDVVRLLNGNSNSNDNLDGSSDEDSGSPSNILTWAGQVWDPEAYNLSNALHAASFPFVALLICQSERSVSVLDSIHGFIDHDSLVERLQNSITASRREMNRVQNEQRIRDADANLRVEQDREYLESLERDRQRQVEEQRLLEAQAEAEQEEAQRKELEEAMALSAKLSRESALSKKRASLQRETPSGSDSAQIRFQLPQGVKLSQTFWRNDSVGMLYDFLDVHFADNNIPIENFVVSTNFPKKDLTDRNVSVEDVGLHPRGALFVHNLDS